MKRVVGPEGCSEIDGAGGRAYRRKDGTFHLSDGDAKRLVAAGGGFVIPEMSTASSRSEGYRCTGCGFGSWFRTCSRCGSECFRETDS